MKSDNDKQFDKINKKLDYLTDKAIGMARYFELELNKINNLLPMAIRQNNDEDEGREGEIEEIRIK